MRILMLDNEFPPLGGGTGTVNDAILRRLALIPNLEIDLVTSALDRNFSKAMYADRIDLYKVPVNSQNLHHSGNRELIKYAVRAWRLCLKLHRMHEYDLCMAWSAVPAGWVALLLRRQRGLKYFVRVSGPDIPGFEARYQLLYPVLKPLIRSVWHGAEVVVTKCESEAQMVQRVDRQVNLARIPNGVDLNAFRPTAAIPDGGTLKLLCVARLIERKGQAYLIRAIKELIDCGIDVTLDLIGTGDALHAYQSLARSLGVANRVYFLGYVPRAEIAAYYSAAHLFVLASFNEGMSVATLEAMASGLPVIVSRVGGTEELVEEGMNGLMFDWADVRGLVAHIQRLASDRSLARSMGAASRRRAAQFSWETAAHSYLQLFKRLVES